MRRARVRNFIWSPLYVARKKRLPENCFSVFQVACGLFDVAVAVGNAWQFVFDGGAEQAAGLAEPLEFKIDGGLGFVFADDV